jgi:hypothetical protein
MTGDRSDDPPFPQAPEIERRIRIPQWRALGVLVILAVPAMALAGVFGESRDRATSTGPNVSVQVEFPTRYRYKMLNSINTSITNRSARPIDTTTVRLDSSYALRFSTVVFTPAAERAYEVPLTDIAPGETRLVVMELQGERYGRHRGRLHIQTTNGDTLAIPISTVIFP